MSITKQIAATLYAYDYKLVDDNLNQYQIIAIEDSTCGDFVLTAVTGYMDDEIEVNILQKEIGEYYFILARQMSDLTKNIDGVGVPIVELAKIAFPEQNWGLNKRKTMAEAEYIRDKIEFWYSDILNGFNNNFKSFTPKQEAVFQWLDTHHFLCGVDESLIKYIE